LIRGAVGTSAPLKAGRHSGSRQAASQGDEIRALLDRVFAAFTDCGVSWALLRGRAEMDTGRDVDLLVATDQLRVAEEIVLELGGVPLLQRRYPWHSMHVLDVSGAKANLKLDIVDHLIYSRELQIASSLEAGCLERRVSDGPLFLLCPTDAFWTILLHCVLDKRRVKQQRGDELLSALDDLVRPSPGEEFFASLCPPDWSPARAIDCVARRDWQPLGRLGSRILSPHMTETSVASSSRTPDVTASSASRRSLIDKALHRATTIATGAAYRKVWRALGLGLVPNVFDVVEKAAVDATVIDIRRRPGRLDIVLAVEDRQLGRLLSLISENYRSLAGRWRRVDARGLESVRLVPASELSPEGHLSGVTTESSLPLPGRRHCRMALGSVDR
jgi:hypothetical protein